MDNGFISYKTEDRKENNDVSTIDDTIEVGREVSITDYNLSLLRSIDNGKVEYPYENILDDYLNELKSQAVEYEMTDEQFRRYRYRPDLFSYDTYGVADYQFIILLINGINKARDFNRKKIKYIDPEILDEILSYITNAEEDLINNNRSTYKENKYF